MSLELALAENTAVMKELIGAWKILTLNAVAAKGADKVNAGGVTVAEKAPAPKPEPTPAPTPVVAVEEAIALAEIAAVSPSELTYDQVSKAITTMAVADRPRLIAALAKFGAKRGPELKPEQYADFMVEMA